MNPIRSVALPALVLALTGCASVPFDYPRENSYAVTVTNDTSIGREVTEWTEAHNGLSGFYPLVEGMDAFAARLRLIEAAERTIDLQYFLMKDDTAGRILAAALLDAADRGVRIRFLLDDVFTSVGDAALVRLDQHENIEVRLYNPVARGGIGVVNFVFDFKRANRRMHNKSFTVDNQVTIVGGRNIADEYFEIETDADFIDLDIIGIGRVAADVSDSFDVFWNDRRAVPMAAYAKAIDQEAFTAWRASLAGEVEQAHKSAYARAMESRLIQDLLDNRIALYPAAHQVLSDDPDKLGREIGVEQQALVNRIVEEMLEADAEILVITPYLVPLQDGVDFWRGRTDSGLRVLMLTNSLASNNHVAVHSAYSKYRPAMVDAGVDLYEARVDAVTERPGEKSPGALTLHTKAFLIDRDTLYVGSLNLDPRSIEINVESGVLVYSSEMVSALAAEVLEELDEFAYRIELDENGRVRWHGTIDGIEVIETTEPQTSAWLRMKAFFLKIVPDSQL
jgi:putative cardiolipin synthase